MAKLTQEQLETVAIAIEEQRFNTDTYDYLISIASAGINMNEAEKDAYRSGFVQGFMVSADVWRHVLKRRRKAENE